jgi:hypothetical protein
MAFLLTFLFFHPKRSKVGVLDHRVICVGVYAPQNKFSGTKPIFRKTRVIDYITGKNSSTVFCTLHN